jgi:hypothetical protein
MFAGTDVDCGHAAEQTALVEEPLRDRKHARMHGHRLEHRIPSEEVVHALGRVAFGLGVLGTDVELGLEPPDRGEKVGDQLRLDGVFDDREAVGVDAGEVLGNHRLGQGHA